MPQIRISFGSENENEQKNLPTSHFAIHSSIQYNLLIHTAYYEHNFFGQKIDEFKHDSKFLLHISSNKNVKL